MDVKMSPWQKQKQNKTTFWKCGKSDKLVSVFKNTLFVFYDTRPPQKQTVNFEGIDITKKKSFTLA